MKALLEKEEEALLQDLKDLITYSDFYFHIKDTKKDITTIKEARKKIKKGKGEAYQACDE